MPKTHWIVTGGLRGYMPSHCDAYHTREQAVQAVVDLYDLEEDRERKLRKELWLDLTPEDGNQYVQVSPCTCATPQDHTEDGKWEEEDA